MATRQLSERVQNLRFMQRRQDQRKREDAAEQQRKDRADANLWTGLAAGGGMFVVEDTVFPVEQQEWGRQSFGGFTRLDARRPQMPARKHGAEERAADEERLLRDAQQAEEDQWAMLKPELVPDKIVPTAEEDGQPAKKRRKKDKKKKKKETPES